ncbi:MAG: tRNA (N(6)-L-threonylcarbamoyladenosine(37)-C(2))-methylthiotransferase MtaB [Bacteroidales bacterium]|nr:tRNA (N(6)-L-threonylcarbamoyladenosine(37)-C(2))-methylthiotransferase MtaB [Bacteroidales bacterium]
MGTQKTFQIHTFGCKLNFSESSEIARRLVEGGLCVATKHPDYIIVNSCAVTATAEKKGRNDVARIHRENPESEIVVVGCHSSLRPEEIEKWNGVVKVFGNRDKMSVVDYILGRELQPAPRFFSSYSSNDRTRSFLKIQDGCDYHCAYCTVADARGESRSDTISHVLENIEKIHAAGINEVILTGVNLGDFGKGTSENFYKLLQAIDNQNLIHRFRISSIEPHLLTDNIIDLVASSQTIMPHFHIPLQSGCEKILKMMGRRYSAEFFAKKILTVKEKIPDVCIALDVITGFPSESDSDFEESYNLIDSLPISYLHVFTYSRRPGTPAATMEGQIPEPVKRERTDRLLELSEKKKRIFYSQHLGEARPVLWESDKKNGLMFGFTDNYIKVKKSYDIESVNKIYNFTIKEDNICLS